MISQSFEAFAKSIKPTDNDSESPISEQSPLLLKMKYMILIIIGYLLYDILYNNIKGYYT